jgi:DNA polymerase III epsilon subunit-like protein
MVIDKHLDRFRKGRRTLAAICEAYGVDLPADEAHTAGADALAACRAAWVLGAKGEVKRRVRSPDEGRELATLKVSWSFARDNLERTAPELNSDGRQSRPVRCATTSRRRASMRTRRPCPNTGRWCRSRRRQRWSMSRA